MREESSTGTGDISKDGASAWRTDRALRAQDHGVRAMAHRLRSARRAARPRRARAEIARPCTDRALRRPRAGRAPGPYRRRRQPRPATGEADGPVELMTSPSSDDDQQHDPDQNKKNGHRTGYDEHSAGAPSPNIIGRPPLIITVAVDHREEHLGLQHEEDERTRPRKCAAYSSSLIAILRLRST